MSNKYKKYMPKVAPVDAVQFDPEGDWPSIVNSWLPFDPRPKDMSFGYIDTPKGKINVMAGDWIIVYEDGEITTLKPAEFEAKYEKVAQ